MVKKLSLIFVVLVCLGMNLNPADFDPYHDNDHDTYSMLSRAFAQDVPGRENCWGADVRCSDGKYRDFNGKEQPDTCNNDPESPDKCACSHATDPADDETCAMHNPNVNRENDHDQKCKVYCRGGHCHCTNYCDD